MELRNVTRYYPEEMPYGENIQYFRSEDGQDFYESLDKFTKKYKLCIHPETGVIYSMAEDVSRLYPAGFTIVEVDDCRKVLALKPAGITKMAKCCRCPLIIRNWQKHNASAC